MNIVINPISNERLTALSKDLPQSLLLTGESGVGLQTIARQIAGKKLNALIEPLTAKEEVDHVTGTISVEAIRGLYEQTRTKQTGTRVITIDDADRMSTAAQAAFLKLLEEPNDSTRFILTSHAPQQLLPTIRSRVQRLNIDPATPEQTAGFLHDLGVNDAKKRVQLEFLASGLPAELYRLAHDETYFMKRAEEMGDARDLLSAKLIQRVLIAQKYHQDRSGALRLIESAMTITRRSLTKSPNKNQVEKLDELLQVYDKIAANQNIRLQLLDFVL